MSLDEQIATALHASAALVALVGGRIYNSAAPEDVDAPFLVFQESSEEGLDTLDTFADAAFNTYLFSSWSNSPSSAKLIRSTLRAVIRAAFPTAVNNGGQGHYIDPVTKLHNAPLTVQLFNSNPT